MSATVKHYVGAAGTIIYVDTKKDLAAATTMQINVRKPSGEETWWDAVIGPANAVGQHTIMQYTTVVTDWDEPGWWSIQAYIITPTFRGRGATAKFQLFASFQ